MKWTWFVLGLAGVGACVGDDPAGPPAQDAGSDAAAVAPDSGTPDAGADAVAADASPPRRCQLSDPFVTIEDVAELNEGGVQNFGARLSADGLTVYLNRFYVDRPARLYVAKRATRDARFDPPEPITGLETADAGSDGFPFPVPNDQLLYFQRGTEGEERDIYTALVEGTHAGSVRPLSNLSVPGVAERTPYLGPDGMWLSLRALEAGTAARIHFAATAAAGFAAPVPVDLHTPAAAQDDTPVLSADGSTLYFSSSREPRGIWVARREGSQPFAAPVYEEQLNPTDTANQPSFLSSDNCELWFARQPLANDQRFRVFRALR